MDFLVLDGIDAIAWQLRPGQKLRMVRGDDESVIHNDCSGETHLLGAIAVSLLEHLTIEPANFLSISTFLASAWEFESKEELEQTVHGLLADLDELSLIETCPS